MHSIIVDDYFAVHEQSRAVVRTKVEGILALLFDLKFTLDYEAKIVTLLGEVRVGNTTLGLAGLNWF